MNDISLVYYGSLENMGHTLLLLFNIVEQRPATSERSGLYCVEKKYGKEEYRPLSLDVTEPQSENILLYRFLSDEEINFIRHQSQKRRYYVLAHRHLDLEHIKEIGINYTQLWVICDYMQSPLFKNADFVKKSLNTKNLLRIKFEKTKNKSQLPESEPTSSVPVFVLYALKAMLSPAQEAKRITEYLKQSNIRILYRVAELIDFCHFLVQAGIINQFVRLYYLVRWIAGFIRVLLIKMGYGIRHLLLMSGFKSFGFFVDGYNFIVRCKDAILQVVWYRFCYYLYFDILKPAAEKIWQLIVYLLYYKLGHFLYYRIGYFLYFVVWCGIRDFFLYQVRHAVLMVLFKGYGLVYDIWMWIRRVTKLILLYPFFKIYWFISFQYNKRLKKYLKKHE